MEQGGRKRRGNRFDYPKHTHALTQASTHCTHTLQAPDMETYSKAVNAGQVPFSILALQQHVADRYVVGLYGNTMTTNPRALDIATATMNAVTPAIRSNILERGEQFQEEFGEVCKENSDVITHVTGGGLLQAGRWCREGVCCVRGTVAG